MNLPALTFKTNMQLFAAIIVLCLLFACHRHGQRKNEITKVEIATGLCFGACQRTAVSIDSSLDYRYYGDALLPGNDEGLVGYYRTKVTPAFWDTLNIKFEDADYEYLDTVYNKTIDDQSLELIIHYRGKTKHIRAQSASLPRNVSKAVRWITRSYRNVKPKAVQDSFIFETTLQYPFPAPLPPSDYKPSKTK